MHPAVISRLAPTPSGFLHLGNAFNFLLTWLLVDYMDGHLLLRIDDLDAPRVETAFVEDIFVQLEWLGISYDSGPSGPDELLSKYSQRLRKEHYFETIELLRKSGHLYACQCSRAEIRKLTTTGIYPGTCRRNKYPLENNDQAWRVQVPEQTLVSYSSFSKKIKTINVTQNMGDFIIKRRDGLPAYQLASLVDDLDAGVTLVVRGQDLRTSTAAQLYLAKCLNEKKFPASRFVHHNLIKNDSGQKLSKSKNSFSLQMLQKKYRTPTWIYQETAKRLKLPFHEILILKDLKEVFKIHMDLKPDFLSVLD
ncbi:MAG: tRNA glutamyl-Q synthetase [SAR324 cluster bacterium]|nr:tRNA glutamyl-Q synthetase [SAR324 cluster bacterium]MBL7035463.1 tRNA glutamyl-Q synthetase [SAR324 cluster bacterium]